MPINSSLVNPVVRTLRHFPGVFFDAAVQTKCLKRGSATGFGPVIFPFDPRQCPCPPRSGWRGISPSPEAVGKIFLEPGRILDKNPLPRRSLCGIVSCGFLEVVLCRSALVLQERNQYLAKHRGSSCMWLTKRAEVCGEAVGSPESVRVVCSRFCNERKNPVS